MSEANRLMRTNWCTWCGGTGDEPYTGVLRVAKPCQVCDGSGKHPAHKDTCAALHPGDRECSCGNDPLFFP